MKPVRRDRSLERRAAVIEARIAGKPDAAKSNYSAAEINKRVNFLVLTYGASQRLADNIRKQEPAEFWEQVAVAIEARIPA